MSVYIREIKAAFKSFCVWGAAIIFMMLVCILLFPQMKSEMDSVSSLFANMGGFTEAFGMDRLNFGEIMGFYGIECGNIMGIGGAFFAAFIGVSIVSKEEKDHTAEFLLTHPISRSSVLTQKLLAVLSQLVVLNILITLVSYSSIAAIGEEIETQTFLLLHFGFLLMQIEIAGICFGISAFIRRGSIGIGIGFAAMLYFLNIIGNISDKADFIKYITPFAYSDSANIVTDEKIDAALALMGMGYAVVAIAVGYIKYNKKDIS